MTDRARNHCFLSQNHYNLLREIKLGKYNIIKIEGNHEY